MRKKDGRVVLVTGSSRGIGFAAARRFAENGDRVVLNGKTDERQLTDAVETIRQIDSSAIGFLADMSNYEEAASVFSEIHKNRGPVEVLVNNAGAAHFGLFSDMTPTEWDFIIKNNLHVVLNASHLAVPDMVYAKQGAIINISSVWGISGASCEAAYSAAKGAVHTFTRSLAKELGPSGVRVNAIACGAVDTRMNSRLTLEEKELFTDNIPLMRFGQSAEAGSLALFLASEDASYITGQVIALDGGLL